jgi:hypothetical protein
MESAPTGVLESKDVFPSADIDKDIFKGLGRELTCD